MYIANNVWALLHQLDGIIDPSKILKFKRMGELHVLALTHSYFTWFPQEINGVRATKKKKLVS